MFRLTDHKVSPHPPPPPVPLLYCTVNAHLHPENVYVRFPLYLHGLMNCKCNYESRISLFNIKFAFRLLGFRLGSEWLQNVRLGWVSQAARAQNTSRQFCKLCQISSSAVLDKVDPAARSETQSIAATSFCTGDWIKRHERKSKYKRWYKMSHISPALFCYKTLGNSSNTT